MKKSYLKSIFKNLNKYCPLICLYILSQIYFFYKSEGWMLDDGMIIATMVRNFQEHTILTHHLTNNLGTATSPLFALIAGIISKTGLTPIISLKLLGASFLLFIAYYAYNCLKKYSNYPYNLLPSVLILLFPHNIAYSQGGLPTFFYSFLIFACLFHLFKNEYNLAILYATLALTARPDGILLFIIIVYFFYKDKISLKTSFTYLTFGLILYCLYLFIHFIYYDSIFPHSIYAKSIVHPFGSWSIKENILKYLSRMFIERWYMNPFYILATFGFFHLYSKNKRFKIFIFWWLLYHLFYFIRIPLYSWYLAPPMPILMFFCGQGIIKIFDQVTSSEKLKKLLFIFTIIIFTFSLIPYTNHKQLFGYHNKIVLEGIGTWLNKNKRINDSVMTETLGFIGYYSKMKVYDTLGLADRDIPILIKNHLGYEALDVIIQEKKPDFLALRSYEWKYISIESKSKYKVVEKFNSPNNISDNYIIAKNITN